MREYFPGFDLMTRDSHFTTVEFFMNCILADNIFTNQKE